MDNIEGKLDYLQDTKSIIKASIENKGISIPDVTSFREYANAIDSISGGIETVELVGDIGDSSSYLPVGNKDKDMVFIESLGVYQYNSESEEEADGESIINTETGIGKWKFIVPAVEYLNSLIKSQSNKYLKIPTSNVEFGDVVYSVAEGIPSYSTKSSTTSSGVMSCIQGNNIYHLYMVNNVWHFTRYNIDTNTKKIVKTGYWTANNTVPPSWSVALNGFTLLQYVSATSFKFLGRDSNANTYWYSFTIPTTDTGVMTWGTSTPQTHLNSTSLDHSSITFWKKRNTYLCYRLQSENYNYILMSLTSNLVTLNTNGLHTNSTADLNQVDHCMWPISDNIVILLGTKYKVISASGVTSMANVQNSKITLYYFPDNVNFTNSFSNQGITNLGTYDFITNLTNNSFRYTKSEVLTSNATLIYPTNSTVNTFPLSILLTENLYLDLNITTSPTFKLLSGPLLKWDGPYVNGTAYHTRYCVGYMPNVGVIYISTHNSQQHAVVPIIVNT